MSNLAEGQPRLRIAVLHRHFDPAGGGAEHYAVALVEQLAERHDITVFAQRFGAPIPHVRYVPIPHWFEKPRYLNQLIYACFVAWNTRRGFDIIHSHENTWVGNVQTVHVLPLSYQLFANRHGWRRAAASIKLWTSPRLAIYKWLESRRLKWNEAKKVVAVAEPLRATLQNALGCDAAMLAIVPPGVDLPEPLSQAQRDQLRLQSRLDLALPIGDKLLLWIGNDANKKGLITLLQALARLPSDHKLLVVGAAQPRASWQTWVTPQIQDRVIQLGVVKEMTPLYWAADVLVHPTREDTFGMVVLEAMAHSLPVVVSSAQYCGIASELTHGQQALILSDPFDAMAVMRAILAALDDGRCRELAARARGWAELHSWENVAKAQEKLYFDIKKSTK